MGVKAIVALSGGMDSTTALAVALDVGYEVPLAVGFKYGSKHNRYENAAAEAIAKHYGVPFTLVDLTNIGQLLSSNLLVDGGPIPEGHYEAETMRQTVVPGRNIIFASVLAGVAWSRGCSRIILGIHAGDHFIYPDCRPEFYRAMREAIWTGTGEAVFLEAPFLHLTKVGILRRASNLELRVPYELTRTCYKDQMVACGKCGSCQERLTAFSELGQQDPLEYESRELLPKQ